MRIEQRRPMSSRMDDLPLILAFTLVAFVLGAATPVIVQRLEPGPPRPVVEPQDLQALRDAMGALDRNMGDLSRTVTGIATDVDRLRAELAAARQPPHPEPPAAPPASAAPSPGPPPVPPSEPVASPPPGPAAAPEPPADARPEDAPPPEVPPP